MIISLAKRLFSVGTVILMSILFTGNLLVAASDSEDSSSDERDVVLPVHAPTARFGLRQRESGSSPDHPLELVVSPSRDSGRSPLANSRSGSRIRAVMQLVPRLDLATVTPEDYDDAKILAEECITRVGGECSTERSSRIVITLRKNLQEEIERKKQITLANSIDQQADMTGSDERDSSLGCATPLLEQSEKETFLKIIRSQEIANNLLAQSAVRAQDAVEWAKNEARTNANFNKWSLGSGLIFGVIGLILSVIAFVPINC